MCKFGSLKKWTESLIVVHQVLQYVMECLQWKSLVHHAENLLAVHQALRQKSNYHGVFTVKEFGSLSRKSQSCPPGLALNTWPAQSVEFGSFGHKGAVLDCD